MKRFWLVPLMVLFSCRVFAADAEYVSLAALLSVPERFDGKRIITAGYLQGTHTGSLLMLHEADAKHGLLENSIGVQVSNEDGVARIYKREKNYVHVKGVFHAYEEKKVVVLRGYIDFEDVILSGESFVK